MESSSDEGRASAPDRPEADDPADDPVERARRVDQIFDRALDLPAAERGAYLDEACAGDADLRARVERLLARSEELPTALVTGGAGRVGADPDDHDGPVPERIGPYRVLGELGRGGMGVVYLGERADGHFRQKVAIKIMRPGSEAPEARRRFEQERQIIASLQHPNIARLFDGGLTDDGRPFSAMEHVEGRPIHRACDEERLGIEERLRIFEVVAAAVHHAHQNLVVHRDLKPSNILVTSAGEVKLLDFGIAKLLDLTSEESLEMTRTGALPVTPLYASPEQLLGEAVTTASDVYQLGLLLFELLTGEAARRSSATPATARLAPEVVPSQAVESLPDERRAEVAAARSTTPRGLVRTLRPELDAVVRAALRPEPSGRYASAAELADDVRRVRRHEPLSVRPATVRYRAGRFLRRNRLGVALGALFVLLLVAYSVVVTLQAQRIARERDRSERIQAFALGLYGAGDPNEALGPEVSAVQLVDRGVERAQEELADESDVRAEVLGYFANVYVRLGRYDEAESLYRQVLSLRRSLHGAEHPEVATALDDLARLLLERDDPEALVHIEEALAQRRRLFGPDHTDTARSLVNLGRYRRSVRELDAAEEALRAALEIYCAENAAGADCADTLAELGWVANLQDRPEEAERLLRRNLEINRALYGEVHPEVATAWNNLGNTLWRLDRWREGDEAMARSMEVMRQLYGASHPDIASSLGNLAHSLHRRGRFERAIELFGQSRDMRIELLGPRHVRVAETTAQLAETLRDAGRHDEAAPRFEEALSIFGDHLPSDHPSFARVYRGLGTLKLATGELEAARRALEAAREIYAGPAGSLWPWRVDVLLAEVDRRQGDARAAAARLDGAEEHLASDQEWLERLAAERALLRQQDSED